MERRTLGNSGPRVSALGLGCMGMSEFYGGHDDAASLATLEAAFEAGVDFWDTADMYGPFTNEMLVGQALRGRREQVILATKFGIERGPDPAQRRINGRPEYVHQACNASLKRLGTDYIDVYYLHRIDPAVPIEETVGAMGELADAGKVRHLGLSEAAPDTLRRACRERRIAALQTEYSLWSREPEDGILEACRELGAGFVAYSPLGRGFLTGRIRSIEDLEPEDYRRTSPRFQGENFARNLALADKLETWGKERGVTAAQLALAWVLAQGPDIVPIAGMRRRGHLEENLGALALSLSAEDLRAIEEISPKDAAAGARYPASGMESVNR